MSGGVVSVGVETDLDAVRIAQTDDDGSAAMTLDDLVILAKIIESRRSIAGRRLE